MAEDIIERASQKQINLRTFDVNSFGVSLDETVSEGDIDDLLWVFGCNSTAQSLAETLDEVPAGSLMRSPYKRLSEFLQHPVFNSYHSETNLVRYMKLLENKD